ncbi:MAG: S8 family serine peptidase [Acidobacteriota bacterium]|nr:S8 family serine peptidase [Acidobacteriota bacterium]
MGRADRGGADGLHTNSFGGTSSATPLAAGVDALVLSVNPNLTRTDLRDVLASNAEKIGSGYDANGHSNQFGFGRIDAGRAVQEAVGMANTAATATKGGNAERAPSPIPRRRTKKAAGKQTGAKKSDKRATKKADKKFAKKAAKKRR